MSNEKRVPTPDAALDLNARSMMRMWTDYMAAKEERDHWKDIASAQADQLKQAREIISDLLGETDPDEDGTPNVNKELLKRCRDFFAANPAPTTESEHGNA